MYWLIAVICDGSLVAHQTTGAEVPASNPASPKMVLMRCRIIASNNVENLKVQKETYLWGKKIQKIFVWDLQLGNWAHQS